MRWREEERERGSDKERERGKEREREKRGERERGREGGKYLLKLFRLLRGGKGGETKTRDLNNTAQKKDPLMV